MRKLSNRDNGRLHVSNLDAEELAVRDAEQAVISALAFCLADIDQHHVTADLFFDPVYRTMFVALLAYHRQQPDETQCTANRLIQFMASSAGLSHLLATGAGKVTPESVSPLDFGRLLEPGWHTSDSIDGNLSVLREADFQRRKRQMFAELAELQATPAELVATARKQIDALAESAGVSDRNEADPWLLPVDADDPWPEPLVSDALIGSAGDFVRIVGPHTESDEAALLFHFLAYAGAMFGRHRFFTVESARHFPQLFITFVGQSSKGRKGTALRNVENVFIQVDSTFAQSNVVSGLSSGEGLIFNVRDPVHDVEGNVTDQGVADKRLLVIESEFAGPLKVIRRESNTLSAVIREAWDSGRLRTLTKNNPTRATDAHISVIAHTTREELRRLITETDQANGFGNRFLWCCTKRSKLLPDGGNLPNDALNFVVSTVRHAVEFPRQSERIHRTQPAAEMWREAYGKLATDRPGLLGAVTNRAEAQVLRLSLIYALLDMADAIDERHLRAALECWRYCEESARFAFGGRIGDATADEVLAMLKASMPAGMTRTDIRDAFQRNKTSAQIRQALEALQRRGLAHMTMNPTTGRPAETWRIGPTP